MNIWKDTEYVNVKRRGHVEEEVEVRQWSQWGDELLTWSLSSLTQFSPAPKGPSEAPELITLKGIHLILGYFFSTIQMKDKGIKDTE